MGLGNLLEKDLRAPLLPRDLSSAGARRCAGPMCPLTARACQAFIRYLTLSTSPTTGARLAMESGARFGFFEGNRGVLKNQNRVFT